jgi:L-seryl-tRNA(Ser) seleniumtransferase
MEGLGFARVRDLPSVSAVLNTAAASALLDRFGRVASTNSIRAVLDDARRALQGGAPSVLNAEDVALQALLRLNGEDRSGLGPLFNLTGTVLHTNLGRAVLAEAAIEAAVAAMRDPVALEFDLSAG